MVLILLEWELRFVQILFAIGLVAILPGYALTTAIFIKYPLSLIEKITFSIGLSLALAAIGGLALNFTRWGLQPASWVIFLGGITLIANALALARMTTIADVDLTVTNIPLHIQQVVLISLAGLIITGAYLTARAGAENRPVPQYSQLWILWTDDTQTEVTIGLHNHEDIARQYRIQISTRGHIQESPIITLAPDTTWQTRYTPPPPITETDFIRATLYRLDRPDTPYREVYLRYGGIP